MTVLFMSGITLVTAQDTLLIRGKVVDGAKQPVSNVSVAVEGSFDLPAVTNEEGEFSIKTVSGNVWLNIEPSSGYKGKRLYLNNRTEPVIYLTEEELASGYDPVRVLSQDILIRDMVAAFGELDPEDIYQTPSVSADQYMQGRVSGMHVINRSGNPGSGAAVFIRGVNSLNTSNQPLYIVDGIPLMETSVFQSNLQGFSYNPLLVVNPMDVSKITVVKDPLIKAAYGSKASNGLVVLETLDPSATQTVIDLDVRTGLSLAPANQVPQLDDNQHKTLMNEVLFTSGAHEEAIREDYPNLFFEPDDDRYIEYQHNTNWQDNIFTNATFSNLNIGVKGGDEIARYGLSFGYLNADGIIETTGYDGYNLRFVSLLNIFTWLKMNAGMSLGYSTSTLKESAKVVETNPILTSLWKSPMLNPYKYDEEGNLITTLADVDELGVSNPQAIIDNYEASNSNLNFVTSIGLEASIKENLLFNSNFGYTHNAFNENIFMPNNGMELYYDDEAYNVSKATRNSFSSFYNNSYLRYNKTFGNDHYLSSNTGVNVLSSNYQQDWGLTKNAPENDQYRVLQDGTNNLREIGGDNRKWNWLSFYEYIDYRYQDKYLLSASASLDGSSRVGKSADNTIKLAEVPFGLFYAGGLGWRVSSEPFLKNVSWLEELKLRVSYGTSGNDDIGELNARNYYEELKFRETTGLYPAVLPNEALSYEVVKQLNGGLDLALWGNRLYTSVDIYRSTTEGMLIYRPVESYFGYDYRLENGGEMNNTGIDLSLFMRIIERSAFKWDINASYSQVSNEIISIEGGELVTEITGAEIINKVGENANSFYGYVYNGVYSTSEEAQNANLVNERLMPFQAGDAKFSDLSGPDGTPDGIINDYDKVVIGSSTPELFGGFNNRFEYKRWELNVFLQFVYGNEVFNYIRYQNESMDGLENQSRNVLNRWEYEGHETDVPRALWEDPIGNSAFSTRWIEDGSYLRVKNVSLSYTIPDKFLAFRNAQFYLTASNLFTLTKYLGYDVEFAHSYLHIEQGIDYGLTPQPRQFMVGIKLGL